VDAGGRAVTDLVVAAVFALLAVTAVAAATLSDFLAAVVVFGVYSLGMAVSWAVFRAPDVALTEAAVGAGVTTALFLVVGFRTGAVERASGVRDVGPGSLLVVSGFVAGLLWTVPALPPVGDPTAPGLSVASAYLVDAPGLGIRNVVTAILVYYRGFDTLGEVVVVLAAAVAVLVVFDREVIE
jgi:multicomponent Na+:H+ antiporter subunit B